MKIFITYVIAQCMPDNQSKTYFLIMFTRFMYSLLIDQVIHKWILNVEPSTVKLHDSLYESSWYILLPFKNSKIVAK